MVTAMQFTMWMKTHWERVDYCRKLPINLDSWNAGKWKSRWHLETENYQIDGKKGNWIATDTIIIDVLLVFPTNHKKNSTVRILKTPKTESSVTYKLKLNGGDIKAVQGDSGHAQVNMVTDVYSHILDDDRRKNAELFEEAFYEKKNLDPQMHVQQENNNATVADEVDPELLAKVLANPEMRALLNSLVKTMK